MKNVNIKARIKRNKLDELAGVYFRDFDSDIVKELNERDKKALVGIQNDNGVYTLIGENAVYYSMASGNEAEISHSAFLNVLRRNSMSLGKNGDFEFVKIDETNSVWMFNIFTMNALWNTIKLLHEAQPDASL